MKPGHELDALIAEQVMCLQVFKSNFDNLYFADSYTVKPYSTNITAAWEVITRLRRLAESFEFSLKASPIGLWSCTIQGKGSFAFKGESFNADTAELAICLAALKAVGVILA